jgi:hypothetical protein
MFVVSHYYFFFHFLPFFLATLGLVWMALFQIFASNSPRSNRFVSDHEKRYIAIEVSRYHFESRMVIWGNLCEFMSTTSTGSQSIDPLASIIVVGGRMGDGFLRF